MKSVRFILSKNPAISSGGDVTVSKLIMTLAREAFLVKAVALGSSLDESASEREWLTTISKPDLNIAALALKSAMSRRSLIHQRFDQISLREFLREATDDLFVAEHSYMAESYIAARTDASSVLYVNSHVSEAAVWRLTKPPIVRSEATRIARDEERVWARAHNVASFDKSDLLGRVDNKKLHWLDMTLEPKRSRVKIEQNDPVAVFLGDRTWPPNELAAIELAKRWPHISEGINEAVLLFIGKRGPSGAIHGPQIVDCGFVDDLDATLGSARVMLAPIAAGGGVRVKVLDAATLGLPVVSTSVGFGSLADSLGVKASDARDDFVSVARQYLLDTKVAGEESRRLYEVNRGRWEAGVPQNSVARWLNG